MTYLHFHVNVARDMPPRGQLLGQLLMFHPYFVAAAGDVTHKNHTIFPYLKFLFIHTQEW